MSAKERPLSANTISIILCVISGLTSMQTTKRAIGGIVCHPITHCFIQDLDISSRRMKRTDTSVGFLVDEFHSKVGKTFPILSERYMRPGTLVVVNLNALHIRLLRGRFPKTP